MGRYCKLMGGVIYFGALSPREKNWGPIGTFLGMQKLKSFNFYCRGRHPEVWGPCHDKVDAALEDLRFRG